jgi:hypothetical protein
MTKVRESAASSKHIQSVNVPMSGVIRRRMSTERKIPNSNNNSLLQFEKEVISQRQAIRVLRNQSIKENAKHLNLNANGRVMDIVDWVKMRSSP